MNPQKFEVNLKDFYYLPEKIEHTFDDSEEYLKFLLELEKIKDQKKLIALQEKTNEYLRKISYMPVKGMDEEM